MAERLTAYRTPRLDRMAERGARFEHCFAQPLCTPSRVQIMTGQYNARNYTKFGQLHRGETTFAHLFQKAGYATCIAGKWQLGFEPDAPAHFGFDEALLWYHTRDGRLKADGKRYDKRYENPLLEKNGEPLAFNNGEYGPDLMADYICDFIERKKDQPFLVYYPMILTHCPFTPTPLSDDWEPESKGSPVYKGQVKYFGDVERHGLRDNTIILFTGDNGTDKPVVSECGGRKIAGAKGSTTDAGTRVPLIVYGPGVVQSGVHDDLVDFSDFLPTLCAMAGIQPPADRTLDGRSFLPQLRGEPGAPREAIYCWFSRNGKDANAKVFARNQRHKLYRDGKFYDIANDPDERSPLDAEALSPQQREVKRSLQAVIERYEGLREGD